MCCPSRQTRGRASQSGSTLGRCVRVPAQGVMPTCSLPCSPSCQAALKATTSGGTSSQPGIRAPPHWNACDTANSQATIGAGGRVQAWPGGQALSPCVPCHPHSSLHHTPRPTSSCQGDWSKAGGCGSESGQVQLSCTYRNFYSIRPEEPLRAKFGILVVKVCACVCVCLPVFVCV